MPARVTTYAKIVYIISYLEGYDGIPPTFTMRLLAGRYLTWVGRYRGRTAAKVERGMPLYWDGTFAAVDCTF
eukprot:1178627-Prorocentrum_minimum.AAC.9